MDDPSIETLVAIVGGVVLGALFAAADAALSSLNEVRLRALIDQGDPHTRTAERLLSDRGGLQSRLLAGRVLCVGLAAGCAAVVASQRFGFLGGVAAAAVITFVFGASAEVGATIAQRRAGRGTLRLFWLLRPIELLLAPVGLPLRLLGRATERFVPESTPDERTTELAVEHMIEQGEETGSIPRDHAALLRGVLEFKDTVAREVMVPRTQVIAIEVSTPLEEVLDLVVKEGHSRFPVYRERLDQVEGVLYAKDLFRAVREESNGARLESLIQQPVFFATESQKIGVLLREMQARRVHLAVVVDEFGGLAGVVTLEDILEEIVGEIQDEHDDEEVLVREVEPGRYVADAAVSLYDLEEVLGEPIPRGEGAYESLGGMVVDLAGRVPAAGELVNAGSFDLVVRDADERHVTKIEIVRRATEQPNAAE